LKNQTKMPTSDLSLESFPNGIQIYQSEKLYKFTKDAVELGKFVEFKSTDLVLDMCAGVGVVGFYAYSLKKCKKLYFSEIQPELCDIIQKNITLNNIESVATCLSGDLKNLSLNSFDKKLDVIICNPPYFKLSENTKIAKDILYKDIKETKDMEDFSKLNISKQELSCALARHEIMANLDEIAKKASELLTFGGKFYIIGVPSRLCEMVLVLNRYGFECKKIQINTNENKKANLILIQAVLNAKSGVELIVK